MKKKTKNLLVLVVLLAIIGIAVGYAALSQSLVLNGTAYTKTKSDWNVHFASIDKQTSETGVMGAECVLSTDKLTGTFEATLIPGGVVTYTVNIENEGTIPAKANGNPVVTLDGAGKAYFTCEVTPAVAGNIVDGSQHTYVVTLKYVGDELPDTQDALTATATVTFNYTQAV